MRRLGPEHTTAIGVLVLWIGLVIATGAIKPIFFQQSVFLAVCYTMATVGVLAVGESIIIIGGGIIDLSLANNAACCALLMAFALKWGVPLGFAILLAIALGASYGLLNGTIVVLGRLNPIVTTLGTSFVGIGALNVIVAHVSILPNVPLNTSIRQFGLHRILGVPVLTLLMVGILILVALAITHTRPGQHLLGVGGRSSAADARGIAVRRVRLSTFALAGVFAGIAGVLISAQFEVITSTIADSYQFPIIAAAILGGTSLAGGRSSFVGLFTGLLLLSTIPTSLAVLGFSSAWSYTLQGTLLLVAISVDAYRTRRGRK